ncbi:putative nucleoside-diphosphate sugar epimerases [Desulfitobacterium sp. LBE]|uniref:TylF/MycF/NovP-related O-methyltransferase n=1 Tax=Desulfitobacterium sp. LBE TaxID=884086 RepID=UPI001198F78B|nr:TylF/MycF/NovP-related O-methyltransferase [Desulfitobacterium sp. LBE]TWH60040.1 putative nucleoside-diphosphate sugar epimerases [Desulfitobacterium sp. LBE]
MFIDDPSIDVIIFGAGQIGQRLCLKLQQDKTENVLFFVDNNSMYWGRSIILNNVEYKVFSPAKIKEVEYTKVCIAIRDARNEIYLQCVTELGIPQSKLDCTYLDSFVNDIGQQYLISRVQFLRTFAKFAEMKQISGAVAEVGVYRGAFAKEINQSFPDRTLYLYDTFEGFDQRDIDMEKSLSSDEAAINKWRDLMGNFANTSEDYVISLMPNPEQVRIRKGYFPDTFSEDSVKFCFVNLDCDLYQPIKAGLEQFFPRMVRGGVILVHEYFDEISFLPGIMAAVDEFVSANNCIAIPIGDCQSIAVLKI